MLTRCPACETTFRITPEQLKVRQGRVRCGSCQHIFNALDTLIDEVVAATPQPTVGSAPAPLPISQPAVTSHDAESPPCPGADFELRESGLEPREAAAEFTHAQSAPASIPVPDVSLAPSVEVHEDQIGNDGDLPGDGQVEVEPLLHADLEPRRLAWPWVLAGLSALILLVLQAALVYRVELAVLYPEGRPLLVDACDLIGCEVALPSKPELMSIESSDLHPDTSQPGRLQLVATLKNRAPFIQTYPHLELTLTDTADQALARKVLAPSDYVARDVKIDAGFGANKDMAITLNLDAGNLPAAGYRLYLFYP